MRSTPGRPYPLIIPLSTGLGKRSFAKIVFSHRDFTTFTQNMVFYHAPRGQPPTPPYPTLGTWGDTQNPLKNDMEKGCSKRRPQSALWGSMGSLREPPGGQMRPKWEVKGSPNGAQTGVFSDSGGKLRNVTKIHYLLHFSHIGPLPK